MQFFKVESYENASESIRRSFDVNKLSTPLISLYEAVGYYVACDIFAKENLPDYNRSTVDGYAVKAANTYGASDSIPTLLRLTGKVEMGKIPQFEINDGETAYVPTGGAIPNGADAMVMLEHTEPFDDDIAVYRPSVVGENIIKTADDVSSGERLMKKGELLTPLKAGVLAAAGISDIKVYEKIKVAIISTGDEIVAIDQKKKPGEIRDTNTILEKALLEQNGFRICSTAKIKDGFELLFDAVNEAKKKADIILISGGSSVGTRDFTEKVLEKQGKIIVRGIAVKPGKPTIAAIIDGKPAIGLPGHPMACLLVLKLLVIDNILGLFENRRLPFVTAATTVNFPSSPGRLTIQPVSLDYTDNGITATPIFYKSGLVSVMAKADGYALISSKQEGIAKNTPIKVFLL